MKIKTVGIMIGMIVISIILITVTFSYKKSLDHKKEINELLLAKDTITDDTLNYSLIDEWSKDESNISSKDFITNISDNNTNSANEYEQEDNKNDDSQGDVKAINLNDIKLLAKLINSEAGDEPFEGKIAVANVVIYRSQENKQPIQDIIYEPGQFDGVNTRLFLDEPSDDSIEAAKEALSGKRVLNKAYYFADLKLCSPGWATNEKFICRIGDHWFFKE